MNHDHLPALFALLAAAPVAVLAQAALQAGAVRGWSPATLVLRRAAGTPPAGKLAALLLGLAGVIHVGLVAGHLEEPLLALSFLAAGVGLAGGAFAAALQLPHWRALAAAGLTGVLMAYAATRLAGVEGLDALGIGTVGVELMALAVVAGMGAWHRGPGGWHGRSGHGPTFG